MLGCQCARVILALRAARAQRLGYAEADPSFDIEGHDTAQKLSILASLTFGTRVDPNAIYVEGITWTSGTGWTGASPTPRPSRRDTEPEEATAGSGAEMTS